NKYQYHRTHNTFPTRRSSDLNQAQRIYDIKGNIILSCMRNMSEDDAILLIEKGRKFLNKGVVAIDLAGPEEEGFANKYKRAIELDRKSTRLNSSHVSISYAVF